jgi:hypothetical protein
MWIARVAAVLLIASLGCSSSDKKAHAPDPQPPGTVVTFSTYLGSTGADFVRDVLVDAQGNLYAIGGTASTDLPTTMGTAQPANGGLSDAFVTKFDPQGQIVWSTYLGKAESDAAFAAAFDPQGNVVIGGCAGKSFETTAGVIQPAFEGTPTTNPGDPQPATAQDGFVAKLKGTDGTRLWATFFGAKDDDKSCVRDLAVDSTDGSIYLAATTDNGTYPAAVLAAFQNGHRPTPLGGVDGVLAKLSGDATQLAWATYVGGSGAESVSPSVRLDPQGNPVVLFSTKSTDAETSAGAFDTSASPGGKLDFYVAKFALNGPLIWATYLGGDQDETTETNNLLVRSDGTVAIAAGTQSTQVTFPLVPGATPYDATQNGNGGATSGEGTSYAGDCAIAILDGSGASLVASTFLGGRFGESCEGVGEDAQGNLYVTGATFSDDFPTASGAYQGEQTASLSTFVAVLSRDLASLRYGTYFGASGAGRALAVQADAKVVFGGEMGALYPRVHAVRTSVAAGFFHAGVSSITVPLGPG